MLTVESVGFTGVVKEVLNEGDFPKESAIRDQSSISILSPTILRH